MFRILFRYSPKTLYLKDITNIYLITTRTIFFLIHDLRYIHARTPPYPRSIEGAKLGQLLQAPAAPPIDAPASMRTSPAAENATRTLLFIELKAELDTLYTWCYMVPVGSEAMRSWKHSSGLTQATFHAVFKTGRRTFVKSAVWK